MKYEITIVTVGEFDNKNYSIFVTLPLGTWLRIKEQLNNENIRFIEIKQEENDYYIRKDKIVAIKVKQLG